MTLILPRRAALKAGAIGLAGAALPNTVFAQSNPSWIPREETEDQIREAMREFAVPGVGIAISEDGDVVWEGAYGVTNVETGNPVTRSTIFQAASLTKPVFAYVVMKMVDAGRIGMDERLVDYVRPHDLVDSDWSSQVTVRHVLTHRTGLPNWRPADNETAMLNPAFEPGSAYSYSGEAFHWLQQVCETITGLGLHDLMHTYLFGPAGLSDMAMTWLPGRDTREVHGHDVAEDGTARLADLQWARENGRRLQEVADRWGRPLTSWRSADLRAAHAIMRPHTHPRVAGRPLWRVNRPGSAFIDSASSLRTTARDYARFIALSLPSDNRPNWQISDETRQAMLATHSPVHADGPNRPVGISWSLEQRPGGVAFDHWGFNESKYISMGLGDTSNRKGIVIMTNGAQGNRFMDKIGPIITGIPYRSFV